ncbi:acyltransferase [Azoarcus sp. KH32C]|uniref:acyltransferase family protein n=1 Tax=Azoarcus sp. KH32C TaxID=748247 RepID=UPI000347ADB6|nr:acyltransferase [Azoarcus sp. KH32C]
MKRLELLDYARFGAGLAVVAYHYFFNGISNGKVTSISHVPELVAFAKYGFLGVEFFFMISGFVIFYSARDKTAGEFLTSRAVRLFPAFWVAVPFTVFFALFWGGDKMSVTLPEVLVNLTMVPKPLGQPFVDGVYWTLQYEWSFYFAVFLVLAAGLQSKLNRLLLLWPFYILVMRLIGIDKLPYASAYYCYFAAGALFALRMEEKSRASLAALIVSLALCVSFSAGKAAGLTINKGVEFSAIVIGAIVVCQFLFFVFLSSGAGLKLKLPGSKLAGGLTYPIYLIHAHFGYMLLSRFANDDNRAMVYSLILAAVFVVAYAIHVLVERRLAGFWTALFARSFGALGDTFQNRASGLVKFAVGTAMGRAR